MASSSQHRCVFVGNIPYDATEEQLVQICEEVGPVVSFRLVLDRETGKPKGYGFCEYKDEETALSARRNLQGYEINGRQLRVDFAENDKNADRNREQGRGGPGLTQNIDIQRPSIALSVPIHQPLGCQLAESAASVMARHLGGDQTCGIPTVYGQEPVSDPLTLYLAKMSRDQLHEVMAELKGLVAQNKGMARQLLQTNPQLSKALFQAQIMLGMVTPQMLQMPQILQSGSAGLQSQVFGIPKILPPNVPSQVLQNVPQIGHTGVSTIVQGEQMHNSIQNPLSFQPTVNPLHRTPVQSQFNIGQVSNSHIQLQGTMQSVPTNLAEKSIPATVGTLSPSPSLAAVQAPMSFQPSLMQQSGHATGKAVTQFQPALTATGTWQQPIQPQQPSSQFSADIETTLLQQVMSLTPEQMGSLSAEQRQQVMQLQQMLRG